MMDEAGGHVPVTRRQWDEHMSATGKVGPSSTTGSVMVIHPAAIPSGAGVRIYVSFQQPHYYSITSGLVQASKQCTGS